MRFLVVDDDPDMLAVIDFALSAAGHRVRIAATMNEALEAAGGDVPDAVLCDVHLSDGDGANLLASFRAVPALAQVPFLFLTADVEAARARLAPLGARGVLAKPFSPGRLASDVERALAEAE